MLLVRSHQNRVTHSFGNECKVSRGWISGWVSGLGFCSMFSALSEGFRFWVWGLHYIFLEVEVRSSDPSAKLSASLASKLK